MFESWPLAVVGAAAVLAGALAFTVDRIGLMMPRAARYWILAFPSGVFSAIAFRVADATGDAWWAVASGNAAMVLAWCLAWNGCRAFDGRKALVGVSMAAAALAGVATLAPTPWDLVWGGDLVRSLLLTGVGVLGAGDILRGGLRTFPAALVAGGLFAARGAFSLTYAGIAVLGGSRSLELLEVVAHTVTPIAGAASAVVGVATLLVLQRQMQERADRGAVPDRPVSAASFARRVLVADRGAVLLFGIALYSRIRIAYGAPQAHALHLELLTAATASAPLDAVVGDLPGGRVGVLATGLSSEEAEALRRAIREDFERTRRGDELDIGVRVLDAGAAAGDPGVLGALGSRLDAMETAAPPAPARRSELAGS